MWIKYLMVQSNSIAVKARPPVQRSFDQFNWSMGDANKFEAASGQTIIYLYTIEKKSTELYIQLK